MIKNLQEIEPWAWITIGFFATAVAWVVMLMIEGWRPIGDEAVIATIATEIWQGKFPWLGMRSTGFSEVDGLQLYHPGPIQFYFLAVGQLLANSQSIGLLIASTVLFILLIGLGLRGAWQAAGWWGLMPATVAFATQAFISQSVLIQILNTKPTHIATPAAVMTAWAVARGRKNAVFPFIFTASVAAQVHVSILPLIILLTITLALILRYNKVPLPDRRTLRTAAAFFFVLWLGPIMDTFFNKPPNFVEFLRYVTLDKPDGSVSFGDIKAATLSLAALALIALVVSVLITRKKRAGSDEEFMRSLAIGLQLSAPIVAFIAYLLVAPSSFSRAVQATFGFGVGYFMASLLLMALLAWVYQQSTGVEIAEVRSISIGLGLMVLTIATFSLTDLKLESLFLFAILLAFGVFNKVGTAISFESFQLPRTFTIGLGVVIASIWVLGIVQPQASHVGPSQNHSEAMRLSDEISEAVLKAGPKLPVEIVTSGNWNIGLYLAPTVNYSLTFQKVDSHFVHPWTFDKDHKRPGITLPDGERLVVLLQTPSGFDEAAKEFDGEILWKQSYETKILNEGEEIEAAIFHVHG